MEDEKLYKVKEVADRLGFSDYYTYQLIKKGELKAIPVGKRSIRVSETALSDYLDKLERGGRGGNKG